MGGQLAFDVGRLELGRLTVQGEQDPEAKMPAAPQASLPAQAVVRRLG